MSSGRHSDGRAAQQTDSERYTYEEAAALDGRAFDGGAVDRRTFLRVAAATGTALALPSAVSATVEDDRLTDLAAFVVDATPDEYEATLVVEFEGADAAVALYEAFGEPDWDVDEDNRAPKVVYREEPTPAAHARLTADELATALEDDAIERVDFSPGANPFWRIDAPYGDYDVHPEYVDAFDVFPAIEDARDWISHTEAGQALAHLEATYPDRVRVRRIGQGPGWENFFTGEDPDRRDIYVAELTENVRDEASFREKDKAVFIVGIHGNERAGVEAGSRILEGAARGEADDFEGLLDDVVLVFVYINPDGWTVRKPQFGPHPYNEFVPGTFYGHYRGNASEVDTNRQYPTIGWANPAFWPAEPEDAPDVRPGFDVGYEDVVPDALATVEHLRGYENVRYLCDYHMMDLSESMVLNLESNAAYDHDGTHALDEVNRRVHDAMYDHWGGVDAIEDDLVRATEDTWGVPENFTEEFLNWGTIYDSIGYNITGGLLGWAGQPEAFGGLGAVTVAPELVLRDFEDWRPYIERHLATAYHLSMREFAELCAAETDATVATGGRDTAYVTSDRLTRSSADLPHTPDPDPGGPPTPAPPSPGGPGSTSRDAAGTRDAAGKRDAAGTRIARSRGEVQSGPAGPATVRSEPSTYSLAARFHAHDVDEGIVRLVAPDGRVVREVDLAVLDERACCMSDATAFYVPDPADGDWTVAFEGEGELDVEFTSLETDDEHPDPEEVFGYAQREYEVTPTQFFADLAPFVEDGEMDPMTVHHVRVGRLLRGNSGKRHYDELVIAGDVARDPAFVSAVEDFVEAGGDLLLTDGGVNLLAELDVGGAEAIAADDIRHIEVPIANLEDRDFEHHLLTDVRELQLEMWKGSQVGYTTGPDSPATVVDDEAFAAAGGDVAGRMIAEADDGVAGRTIAAADGVAAGRTTAEPDGGVAAGTLYAGESEINVLGSVLPVANQRELHPFGMADYAVSFMGHTLLCNALGFEQRRYVDGELVGTWGEIR